MSILDGIEPFLAFAPPPGGTEQGNPFLQFMVPMVLIFGIFYFLIIAPQRRRQKKHGEMLANLKNGDKVITQGGLYGTVVGVSDTVVQIRVADGVKIEIAKHAVTGLRDGDEK